LLRHALRLLDTADLGITLHCHDEVLLEVPEPRADDGRRLLEAAMLDTPYWAKGLPLKAEAKITARYGK
jgi:DNA polymerase I-like protein with 3'-5' exonuclease and polymerase domains